MGQYGRPPQALAGLLVSTMHRTNQQMDRPIDGPGNKTCTITHLRSINDSDMANYNNSKCTNESTSVTSITKMTEIK